MPIPNFGWSDIDSLLLGLLAVVYPASPCSEFDSRITWLSF
jgi:hypothetical protein